MSTSDSVMNHIRQQITGMSKPDALKTVTDIAEECMNLANDLAAEAPVTPLPTDDDAA